MTHEEARAEEVKKVMENEEKEPFYIREDKISPMAIINTHNII